MRQSIAILSLLASSAYAADVVSFFFPGGFEGVDPVATIESANPSTTEFRVACPTGTDSNDCGYGAGLEYTVISQTRYQAIMTADSVSMSLGCDYNSQAVEMTCTVDQKGGNDDTDGPVTAVLSSSEVAFATATVVEGASLLSGGGSASATEAPKSTGAAATTGLKTTVSPTASGSAGASSHASGSGTPTGSAAAATSTGAAARFGIEGSALIVLAGAAALKMW
ncbi:Nn.00g107880.m01.CDS01 [Neocucurbitaria sp. VM-36]